MSRPPNLGVLTPREREIIEALATGRSLKQIAIDQGRAYSTIRLQMAVARDRIGVKTSLQVLVAYFIMKRRRNNKIGNALWEPKKDDDVRRVPVSNLSAIRPDGSVDWDYLRGASSDEEG